MGVEWTTSEWLIINTLWKCRTKVGIGSHGARQTGERYETACELAGKRCGVTPARVREITRRYQIQRRKDTLNV